ncbi:efflux transporter outer membrane subunit [Desulforhopalus sp. 52FAK]
MLNKIAPHSSHKNRWPETVRLRLFRWITISFLVLMQSGCTMLGPDHTTPEVKLPLEWSAKESELFKYPSSDQQAAWWTSFDDATLNKLIELTYSRNLTLQSAAVRILEARAQLDVVQGNLYPQYQEMNGDLSSIGSTGPADDRYYNTASVGFDLGWEIDFWGKFRRGVQSADASLLSFIADYDDLLISLTAEVARTYINIRTIDERIRLAHKNSELQENSLALVNLQLEAGVVTELDVLQAKTLLSSTKATIPSLKAIRTTYANSLAVLIGELPAKIPTILGEPNGIPKMEQAMAMEIPADLLRRRPDIRRQEMQAAAQAAQIGIARTELFPSFTLFGSVGWSANDRGTNSLGDIFNSNSFSYSFGPSFQWNLFHYGRLKNEVRVQDARYQQALLAYQNSVLNAAREVEDAISTLSYTIDQAKYLLEGITTSKKSTELSMLQYQEGLSDYQRVLDATRSLTTKQDQYAQTQGEIATSVVALYKAFGGGWEISRQQGNLSKEIQNEMSSRTDWGNQLPITQSGEKE